MEYIPRQNLLVKRLWICTLRKKEKANVKVLAQANQPHSQKYSLTGFLTQVKMANQNSIPILQGDAPNYPPPPPTHTFKKRSLGREDKEQKGGGGGGCIGQTNSQKPTADRKCLVSHVQSHNGLTFTKSLLLMLKALDDRTLGGKEHTIWNSFWKTNQKHTQQSLHK